MPEMLRGNDLFSTVRRQGGDGWMRTPSFKIVLVIAMVGFFFSQGCMRTYFTEARENKTKLLKVTEQRNLLDDSPRIDSEGDVRVEVRFAGLTFRENLAFSVTMDSRSATFGQYPLAKMATLANDRGAQVQAVMWEILLSIDHRIDGTIYFPSKDASGDALLGEMVRKVTLKIEGLAGIPELVFQWNVLA